MVRVIMLAWWLCAASCSRDIATAAPAPATPEPVPMSCVANMGCRAPTPIPACPLGLTTMTLADVTAHGGGSLGKQIAVRGPLRHTQPTCSYAKCAPKTCCNKCTAYLDLATRDDVPPLDGARDAILFDSLSDPSHFKCVGDESGVCCTTISDGTEVVVQGMLARGGMAEQSHTWRLVEPTLCRAITGP